MYVLLVQNEYKNFEPFSLIFQSHTSALGVEEPIYLMQHKSPTFAHPILDVKLSTVPLKYKQIEVSNYADLIVQNCTYSNVSLLVAK
jgi:hypothetical protein